MARNDEKRYVVGRVGKALDNLKGMQENAENLTARTLKL